MAVYKGQVSAEHFCEKFNIQPAGMALQVPTIWCRRKGLDDCLKLFEHSPNLGGWARSWILTCSLYLRWFSHTEETKSSQDKPQQRKVGNVFIYKILGHPDLHCWLPWAPNSASTPVFNPLYSLLPQWISWFEVFFYFGGGRNDMLIRS